MEFLVVLVVLVVVVAVLIMPLRRGVSERAEARENAELRELEAERTSRYGEIRDAELDFRTGKLSEKDYRAIDRALRAEAVDILRRIDRAGGGTPDPADARMTADVAAGDAPDGAADAVSAAESGSDEEADPAGAEPVLRSALRVEHES